MERESEIQDDLKDLIESATRRVFYGHKYV